ncbi:MAG: hypothetical protein M3O22_02075 [Pseudomonadota bacterium]|nr:hypothetical protein [Pseudomonadota bacterium]
MKQYMTLVLVAALLAGCSLYRKEPTSAGPGGSMGACKQLCDRGNDVCTDDSGVRDDLRNERPEGMTSTCDRQLQQCMDSCARSITPAPKPADPAAR